jgi:glutathione synthase/RimK-type ligase-like ATP-grasp enzyme
MPVENTNLLGFAGITRLLTTGVDFSELGPQLQDRVARNSQDACALLDLATLLILTQEPANRVPAFQAQQSALKLRRIYPLPVGAPTATLRLMILMAPGDMTSNTPVDCLLLDSDVAMTLVYVLPGEALPQPLPEHDAVMVAIGESDENNPILTQLEKLAGATNKPVINLPARIKLLTRDHVAQQLRNAPGIEMPATARVDRLSLEHAAKGELAMDKLVEAGRYPVILRPIGSHGGKDLVKIDDIAALGAYLTSLTDIEFYISNFIDYSAVDGYFRKIRVMMVSGQPFVGHMAISSKWMVHYANADMDASVDKRAEEKMFMHNFDTDFAARHKAALHAIQNAIGLDYFGIDCAETPDGKLLIFEADSAMIAHASDDPEIFPYKLPVMHKLFAAFRAMLKAKSGK